MFRLVAYFEVSLGGQCLIAWPDEGPIQFEAKIDNFDIDIQLILNPYHKSKMPNEIYWTSEISQVLMKVARDESKEPPCTKPDAKGQTDYSINYDFYRMRTDEYRTAARCCINRIIRFLKYRLRTPFLKELPFFDNSLFSVKQWTDQAGNVLHRGPFIYAVKNIPGLYGEFGVRKLDPDSIVLLQQALAEPVEVALHEEILSDAQAALFEDNLRRAVLELAIACEIVTKNSLFPVSSPAGAAFEYFEDKAQIRTTVLNLLDSVALEAFNRSFKEDHPQKYEAIDHLFQCRNKVVHRGDLSYRDKRGKKIVVNKAHVTQWWEAAEALFLWLKGLI